MWGALHTLSMINSVQFHSYRAQTFIENGQTTAARKVPQMETSIPSLICREGPPPPQAASSKLSQQQSDAITAILKALERREVVIALAGPAGSGKTTMIQALNQRLKDKPIITAMTNKAVDVLRQKNLADAVTAYKACLMPVFEEPGKTLLEYVDMDDPVDVEIEDMLSNHFDISLLKQCREVAHKSGLNAGMRVLGINDFFREYFVEWGPRKESDAVLIIDEASMLGEKLLATIRKCFSRIVLVGDEYQLPPVGDEPVFWNDQIVETRIRLTEIHRQASRNQPLLLSEKIKSGKEIDLTPITTIDLTSLQSDAPVIVWRNKLRVDLTKKIRQKLGYAGSSPQAGEPVVCRENHRIGDIDFVNNSMWTVESTGEDGKCILVSKDGHRTKKPVVLTMEEYGTGTGMTCRFGYVLTCHTAQGSEWDQVMIHAADARFCIQSDRESGLKWLYTAVTRARHRVVWVSNAVYWPPPDVPLKPCQLRQNRV